MYWPQQFHIKRSFYLLNRKTVRKFDKSKSHPSGFWQVLYFFSYLLPSFHSACLSVFLSFVLYNNIGHSVEIQFQFRFDFIHFSLFFFAFCLKSEHTGGDHFSFICVINIMLTFSWKYFFFHLYDEYSITMCMRGSFLCGISNMSNEHLCMWVWVYVTHVLWARARVCLSVWMWIVNLYACMCACVCIYRLVYLPFDKHSIFFNVFGLFHLDAK